MSDTTPQPVSNGYRKYVKSKIKFNTFNTFNNVEEKVIVKINESVTSVTRKDLDISYVY